MKELSLNILDIAQNSVKAGAARITVEINDQGPLRTLTITDDGCGMEPDFLAGVTDPFTTTRTTRKVGMGIPLLKLAAEQTGGSFSIHSVTARTDPKGHGTKVTATFRTDHLDCAPLGDMAGTIVTLLQGSPHIHWRFTHSRDGAENSLDTGEMKEVLGDVPIDDPAVLNWAAQAWRDEEARA